MNFVDFLYRIKQQLDLKKDKDVADFLGIETKAFSARKARNAIPVDKVRLALAQHPEIKADVEYILTGLPTKVDLSTKELDASHLVVTDDEQELLRLFRAATDIDREMILLVARRAEKKVTESEAHQIV